MRNAWLSFALLQGWVFLGCSNDNFNGQDGGDAMTTDSPVGTIEGGADDSPMDNYVPPPIHRVFVANQNTTGAKPIVAWDNADTLGMDRAPDVEIVGGMTMSTELVIAKDRLYAWDDTSKVLTGFDNAGKIASSSPLTVALGANAFLGTGTVGVVDLAYDPAKDVLFTTNPFTMGNAVQMFTGASTMVNGTKAKAQFGSTNEPFWAAVLDANDQLYLSETAQSLIRYSTTASTKSGPVSLTMDFGSPSMTIHSLLTDGTRLYASGSLMNGGASVFIYNLAGIHPGSTPDVTLNSANGLPSGVGLCFSAGLANDVLSVACNGKVFSFTNAKTLQNTAQAIMLTNDMINTQRIALSAKTGLLYTVGTYKGNVGLQVWKSPANSPSLQADVRMGIGPVPGDVVLYEP